MKLCNRFLEGGVSNGNAGRWNEFDAPAIAGECHGATGARELRVRWGGRGLQVPREGPIQRVGSLSVRRWAGEGPARVSPPRTGKGVCAGDGTPWLDLPQRIDERIDC